jgi:hypothetical protein
MRPFVIDDSLRGEIKRIVKYAQQHVYSEADMLAILNRQKLPPGDLKGHTVILPFGYKIVYSIVKNRDETYRILSMSVDIDNKLPNEMVVMEVMRLIGFTKPIYECTIDFEEYMPNRKAIKVVEVIS